MSRPPSNLLVLIFLFISMKKSFVLLTALALAATGAFAQTASVAPAAPAMALRGHHKMKSPEKMADQRSHKMAQQLGLSADQQRQLAAALLTERQAMTSTTPVPADRQAMHRAMQTSHSQYEAQVKIILTPDQYTKYTAMQQQRHNQMRAKRQQRMGMSPSN